MLKPKISIVKLCQLCQPPMLSILLALSFLGTPVTAQDVLSDEDYEKAVAGGQALGVTTTIGDDGRRQSRFGTAIECGQIIIAEGDSWFRYPLKSDIVDHLRELGWAVFSTAKHGDTLEDMIYDEKQRLLLNSTFDMGFVLGRMRARLGDSRSEDCLRSFDGHPQAILLSVGGNDIVGAMEFLLEHGTSTAGSGVNAQIADGLFYRLNRTLVEYISMVRQICSHHANRNSSDDVNCGNIPIFVHGYDHAKATGNGYEMFWFPVGGPWLRPAFQEKESLEDADNLIASLIDRYNKLLCNVATRASAVQANDVSPVYFLDFRGAVSDSWQDELHPDPDASRALAKTISNRIIEFHAGQSNREDYCISGTSE